MSDKQEARRLIRGLFPGMEARNAESEAICRHVSGWDRWQNAKVVCGYVPMRREADVMPLLKDALSTGKALLLPRVEGDGVMTLRRIADLAELIPGSYNIPEPPADAPIADPAEAELILVPLEGIDRNGMRLGKGGGFYDRLLPQTQAFTLGVALRHQFIAHVPCDPWDRSLNAAVSADGILIFPNHA